VTFTTPLFNPAGGKYYFGYPFVYGVPTSVKDQNGFLFPILAPTVCSVTNGTTHPVTANYYLIESFSFISAPFALTVIT